MLAWVPVPSRVIGVMVLPAPWFQVTLTSALRAPVVSGVKIVLNVRLPAGLTRAGREGNGLKAQSPGLVRASGMAVIWIGPVPVLFSACGKEAVETPRLLLPWLTGV